MCLACLYEISDDMAWQRSKHTQEKKVFEVCYNHVISFYFICFTYNTQKIRRYVCYYYYYLHFLGFIILARWWYNDKRRDAHNFHNFRILLLLHNNNDNTHRVSVSKKMMMMMTATGISSMFVFVYEWSMLLFISHSDARIFSRRIWMCVYIVMNRCFASCL